MSKRWIPTLMSAGLAAMVVVGTGAASEVRGAAAPSDTGVRDCPEQRVAAPGDTAGHDSPGQQTAAPGTAAGPDAPEQQTAAPGNPPEDATHHLAMAEPDPSEHGSHHHHSMAESESVPPAHGWTTIVHGHAFLNFNRQGGPSGARELESQNHFTASASRPWLGGTFSFLGMFTLEPATIDGKGSAQLFQRGETYKNRLLVDWQHPHELFAQLGVQWEKDLSPRDRPGLFSFRLFAAPVGEPALGPTAFVHRLSASENPSAPLAHHNQDSTHISADVVTAGFTASMVTIEASAFHGKEPDSHRWGIDQGRIDSYSGRIWVRPVEGLAFQLSAGRREEPEELEEGDQTRQTASVEYQRTTQRGSFAAMLAVGRNKLPGGEKEWGNTLEATWKFAEKNFLYSRIERVDRDLTELTIKRQRPEATEPKRTAVSIATLGYVRGLPLLSKMETGIGADATVYRYTSRLDEVYGDRPVSFHAFLRLRFHSGGEHSAHHH